MSFRLIKDMVANKLGLQDAHAPRGPLQRASAFVAPLVRC